MKRKRAYFFVLIGSEGGICKCLTTAIVKLKLKRYDCANVTLSLFGFLLLLAKNEEKYHNKIPSIDIIMIMYRDTQKCYYSITI